QEVRQMQGRYISQHSGQENPQEGKTKGGARIPQRIIRRRIEPAQGGGQKAYGGPSQDRPHVDRVAVPEPPCLVDCPGNDVPESEKPHGGGDDKKGDLTQGSVQPTL